jgi:hypothetical protein
VCSAWRLAHLYQASVLVLAAYSVLYGLTARKARWLGGVTSAAVIILGKLFECTDNVSARHFLGCMLSYRLHLVSFPGMALSRAMTKFSPLYFLR